MKGLNGSLAAVALGGLLVALPGNLPAAEGPIKGEITGALVNGTTGAPVPDQEVDLQRYAGGSEADQQKTRSDSQGKFSFQNLVGGKQNAYSVQVTYKGVDYDSPMITLDGKKQEATYPVTVYDTTDSDQDISIVQHHMVLAPEKGTLWVREVLVVRNTGNKAYVGSKEIAPDKKETLKFSLPAKAQDLQLADGLMSCCVVNAPGGFSDTMGVIPGKKQVSFTYKMDYGFSSVKLEKRINMKTGSMDVFVPAKGIRADGENIQYAGTVGEPGNRFLHLAGRDLGKGTKVALRLKGLPIARKVFADLGMVLGAALVGFGFIFPFVRRKRQRTRGEDDGRQETEPEASDLSGQVERQKLIWAMAELDDRLDAGEISLEEHTRERHILKEKVVQIQGRLDTEGV